MENWQPYILTTSRGAFSAQVAAGTSVCDSLTAALSTDEVC
jgi:hypothetical protein